MDVCICKTNKRNQQLQKLYVWLSSALYAAIGVYGVVSEGFDVALLASYIALVVVIIMLLALWRMRAGHSYMCALYWSYVSPIAELHKSIRSISL